MDAAEMFKAAHETTRIVRKRRSSLYTFGITRLPYYFIARSEIDIQDTVIRAGKVVVEKPQIVVPGNNPMFEGFEFDDDLPVSGEDIKYLLMTRRIRLPSMRYINTEQNVTVESGSVDVKVNDICNRLSEQDDTATGVIRGEDKFFPFPLLMYVGEMIQHSAGDNISELFEHGGGFNA